MNLNFEQGLSYAVARLIREYDQPSIALEILKSSGTTIQDLEKAGVDKYDLGVIKKAQKIN